MKINLFYCTLHVFRIAALFLSVLLNCSISFTINGPDSAGIDSDSVNKIIFIQPSAFLPSAHKRPCDW